MAPPWSLMGAWIPCAVWQRMQSRRVGRSPGSVVRNSWQAKQWRRVMPATPTRCLPWHSTQAVETGSKPWTLAAWHFTQAICCWSKWIRWPREAPICGQRGSWERWQAAQAPTSTSAWRPVGILPATKARSMATPCSGVEWWHFWQETDLWLPASQSENSGLARWQVAQRRGSSSTNFLKRRKPPSPRRAGCRRRR